MQRTNAQCPSSAVEQRRVYPMQHSTAQHCTRGTYTRENESEYTLGAVTTATLPGATCAHWATT